MNERPKYAIVREDSALELEVVRLFGASAVLLPASGGCTALSLAQQFPAMAVCVFDPSQAQLDHLQAKAKAAVAGDLAALNVENDDPRALNQLGSFDGAFRLLRRAIEEWVAPPQEIRLFFARRTSHVERLDLAEKWIWDSRWSGCFEAAFHPQLLSGILGDGPASPPRRGGFAEYVRGRFEEGLRRDDAHKNPFLQHTLLGMYLAEDAPDYVTLRELPPFEMVLGNLVDVKDLERFDVISLSNLLDARDEPMVRRLVQLLCKKCVPGAAILIRQFHAQRDLRSLFTPWFAFDDDLGKSFTERDRSLLYDRIEVAFRTDVEPPSSTRRPPSYGRMRAVKI
jgi:S-adenosylmethionine-diacylglycerol 3-amino-3-carboxypropyl transferase